MRILLSALVLCLAAFMTSCNVTVEDGNYAEDVVGEYNFTTENITSMIGDEPGLFSDGVIRVAEVNDTLITMVVDFESELLDDLDLSQVVVSDASGSDIDLDQEYTNATLFGFFSDDMVTMRIDWETGNWIRIDDATR